MADDERITLPYFPAVYRLSLSLLAYDVHQSKTPKKTGNKIKDICLGGRSSIFCILVVHNFNQHSFVFFD